MIHMQLTEGSYFRILNIETGIASGYFFLTLYDNKFYFVPEDNEKEVLILKEGQQTHDIRWVNDQNKNVLTLFIFRTGAEGSIPRQIAGIHNGTYS